MELNGGNRMKPRGWKIALAALLFLAALAIMVNVTSHAVQAAPLPGQVFIDLNGNMTYDPGTETLYAQIQYAIDNATIGQTVVVGAGTYTEQLSIDASISLVGASMANTTLSCPASLNAMQSVIAVFGSAQANLTGFTISGPSNTLGRGLYVIEDSYVHVWNCTFTNIRHNPVDSSQSPICIRLGNATSLSVGTGLIENCTFTNWQKAAIRVDSAGSYAEVRGCIVHGWSTSSTLVVQVGIYVINYASAYIHDNVIDLIGGTSGGYGVLLQNGATAVIERNQLTGINTGGDSAIGIFMLDPGPGVLVANNTITHWAWGAYISNTVHGPMFAYNLIALNRGSGLQLSNAQNTSMQYNNFIENGLVTVGNGLIITSGSANSWAHYNNFIGNYRGIYAGVNLPFDATLNYWNSFSGPSDSGLGTGDAVHELAGNPVAWNPWLKSQYPPAEPISGSGTKAIVDGLTMLDLSSSAGISVQMTGAGSPLVTAFRYSRNPVEPFYGLSLERYIDVHISTTTGVTQLTVIIHYNQTDVPSGMDESNLRMYWWNGTQWLVVTDSRVDAVANLLYADFRGDTQPTLGQMVGTPLLAGCPVMTVSPSFGPAGTLITAQGTGFFPFSSVTLKLADNFVATSYATWKGNVTVQSLVPLAQEGDYRISLMDSLGCTASSDFQVIDDAALDIQVSVGSLHFRGELATFWASTSLNGMPVDVDNLTARLYNPALGVLNLTAIQVAPGLYCMNFTIPMNAQFGDYAFVVMANYGSHQGIGLTGGQISQTLSGFDARLTAIEGELATIQTDVGAIQMDLGSINARLTSINGRLALIETDVGEIQADVAVIGAVVTSVNGSVATIQSDMGILMENVTAINAQIIGLDSNVALIQTDLGMVQTNITAINAHLVSIDGSLATIQTSVGTITSNVAEIQTTLVGISGDIATVQSTLGRIDVNLTAVNAHLVAIDGTLATVQTSLGTMQTSLNSINARLVAVQGTVATINTTCGALTVSLAALDAKVVQVQGSQVIIQTSLGNINGEIVAMQGDIATIQTDMGIVTAGVKNLENNANNNSTFIIVLLLLIMVILIGLYFWKLRKVL